MWRDIALENLRSVLDICRLSVLVGKREVLLAWHDLERAQAPSGTALCPTTSTCMGRAGVRGGKRQRRCASIRQVPGEDRVTLMLRTVAAVAPRPR